MKTTLEFASILLICAALFFVAPHHRRSEIERPCTLSEAYRNFFSDMPSPMTPRVQAFFLLGVAGMIASFYPALLVLMVRWFPKVLGDAAGGLFICGGLVVLAGAFANFIAIVVSHLHFGFGASSRPEGETVFLFVIPLFQVTFGLISMAIGVSTTCATLATRLVLP